MDLNKLFSLKQPCKDCPFRKDTTIYLPEERMKEITTSLHNDAPFHCHKTIAYDKESKPEQVDDAVYCAGALIYMEKAKHRNLGMRLGIAYNLYDPEALKGHDEVIDPEEE